MFIQILTLRMAQAQGTETTSFMDGLIAFHKWKLKEVIYSGRRTEHGMLVGRGEAQGDAGMRSVRNYLISNTADYQMIGVDRLPSIYLFKYLTDYKAE